MGQESLVALIKSSLVATSDTTLGVQYKEIVPEPPTAHDYHISLPMKVDAERVLAANVAVEQE